MNEKEQDRIRKLVRAEYLGITDKFDPNASFDNPLDFQSQEEKENPHIALLRLCRKPEYFAFTCKHIFGIEPAPFQLIILEELWFRKYPMLIATRGGSKSFMLALYVMLRCLIKQGTKVVLVGAAFRQAKVIFEYCENIWNNAPVLRDIVGISGANGPRRDVDRCTLRMGDSVIIALPLGNGEKIRGQRANVIVADEFDSIPRAIYEEVVSGFASTTSDPIGNMKNAARVRVLKKLGQWSDEQEKRMLASLTGNQAIIAGTAGYGFKHFADYWREYKAIIESNGNRDKLQEIFKGKIPPKFNWHHYSVIRLPVELLPENFMDEEHIARAKATTDSGTYGMEYGCVFATDSNGFYKATLINSCVVTSDNLPHMLPGVSVFYPTLYGDPGKEYVFAVDTASERDNFAIVLLELHSNHVRAIYCWTTNRAKHLERIKHGVVKEKNFYAYCARKIRDLMKVFRCKRMCIDSQGGGRAVTEALHDMDKMERGEVPIWEILSEDQKKPGEHDHEAGLHIIELINFSDAAWTNEANHGLKKDMEDKVLLFPYFDPILLDEATTEDKKSGRIVIDNNKEVQLGDTLEDLVMEIEAMKDELVTIVHTRTANNRDRWDVPEIKQASGKKGRLRKDRYSSLLMANAAARKMNRVTPPLLYGATYGGFAREVTQETPDNPGKMWDAPEWFTNPVGNKQLPYYPYGTSINRNNRDTRVYPNPREVNSKY